MDNLRFRLTGTGLHRSLFVTDDAGQHRTISSAHPMFERTVERLMAGTFADFSELLEMLDVRDQITTAIHRLSAHLSFDPSSETLRWDGDTVDNALSRHILRLMKSGDQTFTSLVAFMERLAANPSQRSRIHLWSWLHAADFTITPDGVILGYKGVRDVADNRSVHAGVEDVLVNGVAHRGHIPNPAGAVVEISRSLVDDDRGIGCSVGLHVGTHDFASGFGQKLLRVLVDPADVVSVPKDAFCQKMRVSRYTVLDVSDLRVDSPVWSIEVEDDDLDWDDEEDVA